MRLGAVLLLLLGACRPAPGTRPPRAILGEGDDHGALLLDLRRAWREGQLERAAGLLRRALDEAEGPSREWLLCALGAKDAGDLEAAELLAGRAAIAATGQAEAAEARLFAWNLSHEGGPTRSELLDILLGGIHSPAARATWRKRMEAAKQEVSSERQ